MKLKKVTFKNYRCFEDLEIELDPRLTVIVGNNGAGKSAILDGIAAVLSKSFNYLSTSNQRFQNQGRGIRDIDIRKLSQESSQISQYADFAYLRAEAFWNEGDVKWDTWAKSKSSVQKPDELYGEKELKEYLVSVIDSYQDIATRKETPVFAYYDAERAVRENIERLRSSKDIDYSYPTTALINALTINQDKDSLRETLEWFDKEEAKELRQMRENKAIENSPLKYVRLAISEILGEGYSNPRFNDKHKFVLTKQVDNQILDLSVLQLSQGYQSMLTLAMDFSRRLSIANNHLPAPLDAPAIMLIDEIDLHLHPSWQQRVIGDLMRTFKNTQFIITTHSPQVLSSIKKQHIKIIEDDKAYEVSLGNTYGELSSDVMQLVQRVSPYPPIPERDDLENLEALILSDKYDSIEVINLLEKLTSSLGVSHSIIKRINKSIERKKLLNSIFNQDKS